MQHRRWEEERRLQGKRMSQEGTNRGHVARKASLLATMGQAEPRKLCWSGSGAAVGVSVFVTRYLANAETSSGLTAFGMPRTQRTWPNKKPYSADFESEKQSRYLR